ncbi:response regulator transcription factor [Schaalia sp. lx-260]|uniref:response regulator transcription factor n=1 Tax=Schaalia sp. lx-260 TaxID=2899082 RepID=UPI001E4E8891|nr:response regulator transcription factor [Schaalia sp. lx-260]MCD4550116.1 response regulator transcription factor [Schaalia sp. lx-260]
MPIRIVIVDDQTMIREAFASLLSLETDIEVVGTAAHGREALQLLDFLSQSTGFPSPADVVLMDIEMPVMDGIATCEVLRARFPNIRVLILTTFGRPGYVQRSLDAGASGFMVKDAPSQQLAEAVRRIASGVRVIDPVLAVKTLESGTCPLTDREIEILRHVAQGGTIADIAKELSLSSGTVRNHVSAAMLKTHARTRAEAVRIATESGWL